MRPPEVSITCGRRRIGLWHRIGRRRRHRPRERALEELTELGRIGYLETGAARPRPWEAFRERLRELGYVEGQTVAFETRAADGRLDRLPPSRRSSCGSRST
jgi:hypothetical protein